ncbi:MAG TPA: hypothetical protein VEV82_01260 [Actinomycetota bacterium]|nr:hypothetical protein [Actinomycetota bacterium]
MESATNNDIGNRPSGGSAKRCPHCGASNKYDARWCGQCLEKFDMPDTEDAPVALDAAKLLSSLADDTLTSMPVVKSFEPANGTSDVRPDPAPTKWTSESPAESVPLLEGRDATPKPLHAAPPVPATPQGGAPEGATKTPGTGGDTGAFNVGEDGITWTCLRCKSVNAMAESVCTACGTTFAEAIKPPEPKGPKRDPKTTAIVSLFLPGAGHAYLGMWPEGIARAIISTWVVVMTIFSAMQGAGPAQTMSFLFGFVATGLWLVSAHDAYREAEGRANYILLKRSFFLYLVVGLLLMSMVMIFAAALGAQS